MVVAGSFKMRPVARGTKHMIKGLGLSPPQHPPTPGERGLEIEFNHQRPASDLINHAYIIKLG